MFCKNCGCSLEENVTICPDCGELTKSEKSEYSDNKNEPLKIITAKSSSTDIISYALKATWNNFGTLFFLTLGFVAVFIFLSIIIGVTTFFFSKFVIYDNDPYTSNFITHFLNIIPSSFFSVIFIFLGMSTYGAYSANTRLNSSMFFSKLKTSEAIIALKFSLVFNLIFTFGTIIMNHFFLIPNLLVNRTYIRENFYIYIPIYLIIAIIYYSYFYGIYLISDGKTSKYLIAFKNGFTIFIKNFLFIIIFGIIFFLFSAVFVIFTLGLGIFILFPLTHVVGFTLYKKLLDKTNLNFTE